MGEERQFQINCFYLSCLKNKETFKHCIVELNLQMFPLFQSLMGVFFYTKSVALIEDVPLEEEYESEAKLITDMETGFQQVS